MVTSQDKSENKPEEEKKEQRGECLFFLFKRAGERKTRPTCAGAGDEGG